VRRNSMFFKNLNNFNYEFKDLEVTPQPAINVFKRARIDLKDKAHRDSFYYYDIQAGDTPEIISEKAYGNPHYYWAILMFNDIVNPFDGMSRSENIVTKLEENQFSDTTSIFYEDDNMLGLSSTDGYTRARFPRVGDIIVKLDGNSPASTLTSVQIVSIDKTLQRMDFLKTTENGLFAEGDSFAIIDKTGDDTYEIVFRSKILKRYDDKIDSPVSFKDPDGKIISALSEAPIKIVPQLTYDFYKSSIGNEEIRHTILGQLLGASGAAGGYNMAVSQGYAPVDVEKNAQIESDGIRRIKIPDAKLLQPILRAMSDALNKSPLSDTVVARYNANIK